MRARYSLIVRLLLVLMVPVLLGTAVVFMISVQMMRQAFLQGNHNRAESIVKTFDSGIGSIEQLKDTVNLQNQILKLIYLNPEIVRISVNLPNAEGELISVVSNEIDVVGKRVDEGNKRSFTSNEMVSRNEGRGESESYILAAPIQVSGQSVGTYEIVLSYTAAYHAYVKQIIYFVSGTIVLFGVMIGMIWILSVRYITNPIKKLLKGTEMIGEGKLDYRVSIDSRDEMGRLAVGINEAAAKLQESYGGLESKVAEKTSELSDKLKEMAELNSTLSMNKSAMINLLEDAKNLEEQLKIEKEGVEKQVAERTRELSEERAELLAVINAIARGLVVIDKNWKVILENKTIVEMIGATNKINYMDVATFVSSAVELDKMVAESFAKQSDVKSGPKLIGNRYLDVHTVPVWHDKIVGAVAIFVKDVTEAISVQRSRDEFFSIASHELRTPLTAIRGNAEMILENYKDKITDKEVTEMLSDIHEGSIRLITIVNDFLNVSRLEMGKMEFKNDEINLAKIASDVIKEFEVSGSRQKVEIKLDNLQSIPSAKGDSDRIKQVLINLIGNGLKFTKDGSIKIELVSQKGMVQVNVVDTGEGIPPDMQGLLFHKFQQAGTSLYTRDTSKGTGLGLYISKLMVEGMGGKIWLEKSEVGKGSTFAFSLPIIDAQQVSMDKKG